ncbi:MAG: hypothetical protein ACYC5H_07560 [Methylovirgula sp.]
MDGFAIVGEAGHRRLRADATSGDRSAIQGPKRYGTETEGGGDPLYFRFCSFGSIFQEQMGANAVDELGIIDEKAGDAAHLRELLGNCPLAEMDQPLLTYVMNNGEARLDKMVYAKEQDRGGQPDEPDQGNDDSNP